MDHLHETGTNTLLVAGYKTGKTVLALNLAKALVDNEPFLDFKMSLPDDGRRVAWWNFELTEDQARRWVRELGVEHPERIPKSRRSARTVPLTRSLGGDLGDYLAQHPRGNTPEAPLFPNPRRGRAEDAKLVLDWDALLRHGEFYRRYFKPAAQRAGLPATLRFHGLRHSYASRCVSAGLHPKEISEFMGHANINTTMGIYAHLFEEDRSAAMAKLDSTRASRSAESNVVPMRRR